MKDYSPDKDWAQPSPTNEEMVAVTRVQAIWLTDRKKKVIWSLLKVTSYCYNGEGYSGREMRNWYNTMTEWYSNTILLKPEWWPADQYLLNYSPWNDGRSDVMTVNWLLIRAMLILLIWMPDESQTDEESQPVDMKLKKRTKICQWTDVWLLMKRRKLKDKW